MAYHLLLTNQNLKKYLIKGKGGLCHNAVSIQYHEAKKMQIV